MSLQVNNEYIHISESFDQLHNFHLFQIFKILKKPVYVQLHLCIHTIKKDGYIQLNDFFS